MTQPTDPVTGTPFKAHRRYYLALKIVMLVLALGLALKLFGLADPIARFFAGS